MCAIGDEIERYNNLFEKKESSNNSLTNKYLTNKIFPNLNWNVFFDDEYIEEYDFGDYDFKPRKFFKENGNRVGVIDNGSILISE